MPAHEWSKPRDASPGCSSKWEKVYPGPVWKFWILKTCRKFSKSRKLIPLITCSCFKVRVSVFSGLLWELVSYIFQRRIDSLQMSAVFLYKSLNTSTIWISWPPSFRTCRALAPGIWWLKKKPGREQETVEKHVSNSCLEAISLFQVIYGSPVTLFGSQTCGCPVGGMASWRRAAGGNLIQSEESCLTTCHRL